jgi:hypothetical protein
LVVNRRYEWIDAAVRKKFRCGHAGVPRFFFDGQDVMSPPS